MKRTHGFGFRLSISIKFQLLLLHCFGTTSISKLNLLVGKRAKALHISCVKFFDTI